MYLKSNAIRPIFQVLLCLACASPAFAKNTFGNLIEAMEPKKDSFLYNEWQKARVGITGKVLDGSLSAGKYVSFGTSLRFKFEVQPAFIKNLHQRFDIYTLNFNVGGNLNDIAGVGVNMGAQVTFSRLLDTKAEALTAPVYFLNRIPWTAEKALKELDQGDAVRIEINSDGSLGKGLEEAFGSFKGHYGISFAKGSRFIIDLYRMRDDRMRMRIIATKTNGSFSFGAGISPIKKWELGLGLIDKQLSRWLRCNPISFSTSTNLSQDLPVDTFMVDYVYNLTSTQGRTVYEEIMKTVSRIHFEKYLNFERSEVRLAKELLRYVEPAEAQYRQDYRLPIVQRSVDRIFKGRTTSDFNTTSIGSGCSKLWSAELTEYNSKTLVRSFERNDEPVDFIYLATDRRTQHSALLNLYGEEHHDKTNGLFSAIRNDKDDELNPIPTSLSDLIISKESRDKDLTVSEIKKFQNNLKHMAPTIYPSINWGDFANEERTNGYINITFVFHQEALQALPKLSGGEIYTLLRNYVDTYPSKLWLPHDSSDSFLNENPIFDQWETDIRDITYYLNTVINGSDAGARLEAFAVLRKMQLFQAIGAGFLISLLPSNDLTDLVYMKLTAGSSENSSGVTYVHGTNDISKIYRTMEYILSVINDRSFDLRTQIDERGEIQIFKAAHNGEEKCTNCDSFSE